MYNETTKKIEIDDKVGTDIKYVISKGKRFQTSKSNGGWERYDGKEFPV